MVAGSRFNDLSVVNNEVVLYTCGTTGPSMEPVKSVLRVSIGWLTRLVMFSRCTFSSCAQSKDLRPVGVQAAASP